MILPEWSPQKALLIAYPHEDSDWVPYLHEAQDFFDEFIQIVSTFQEVWLIAPEGFEKSFPNTRIFHIPTNDTWIRDYGPLSLADGSLLDFTFNGWGLKYPANYDNRLNRRLFGTKKLGFVLEGGSIDSNGAGAILTTSSCLLEANRNPHLSKTQIENYLKKTLQAHTIHWLENTFMIGDDTDGHIDMFARFVSEDTIAYITCDDPKDPHYEGLKKMEEELQELPYRLIPLPWASAKYFDGARLPASYANFTIINGAVIVPTYKDPNDEAALKTFKKLFPDRQIVGLDASVLIRQGGSIHCSSMNLFV